MLNAAVLSCGTDGIDGNSNAAGAVANSGVASAARARKLEISPFIQSNDSHSFAKQAGGLIFTGPTGNNVRDLRIMLAQPLDHSAQDELACAEEDKS
jgi:hydroxypyruvate reductase/glycerate 2-kinase